MTAVATGQIEAARSSHPQVFEVAAKRVRWQQIAFVGCLAYGVFCLWLFGVTFERLTSGIGRVGTVFAAMFVWEDFLSWDFAGIAQGIAESLAMALLGTLLASVIGLPLAFLAARTVVRNPLVRYLTRGLFNLLRGVDRLIWALVFVRAFGLGPLSGTLAITTADIGELGKLYSEALENVDGKQVEGVRATGAGRMQVYRYGFLPQVFPVFLSQSLYYFESNVRSATIMGVVGAGGIGLQLSERMKVQYWDQAAFIILCILATVAVIDWASGVIRRRFIGTGRA